MAYDTSPFAFPQTPAVGPSGDLYHPADGYGPGMTLRDWLAGKAMAGMLAGEPGGHLRPDKCAYAAYEYADAMLDVRRGTDELAQAAADKRHSELIAERSK